MVETGRNLSSLDLPIAASPAEAVQPHSEQTGRPPNWQGEMRVVKSAEMQFVVCDACSKPTDLSKLPAIFAKRYCFGQAGVLRREEGHHNRALGSIGARM
jgi:hypothetical protein